MKFPRVNKKNKCQICGSPDWCGLSPNGEFAICMRVWSAKQTKSGGYIHILVERDKRRPLPVPAKIEKPKPYRPADDHLDEIYAAFLERCVLSFPHKRNLMNRGLSLIQTVIQGYKSMPSVVFADAVAEQLAREFSLDGVPGFYYENKKWHFETYFGSTGYLVPIRNHKHQIVGLTLRRDDDRTPKYLLISTAGKPRGGSSGAPTHFALLGKLFKSFQIKEVIVTEGALKANVASGFLDVPVIGLVSITTFDDSFPHLLKEAFPNLEKAKVAFDMEIFDPKRPDKCAFTHVNNQRKRLIDTLQKNKISTTVLSWTPAHKGLDDYLWHQSKLEQAA